MRNIKNKNLALRLIICTFMLFSITACKKAVNPGDWDIIPPPVAEPPKEPEPEEKKSIVLKVMSYNARLGTAADMAAMIDYIKEYNPDLLILRQVDSETTRANKVDRPKEVGLATGMKYFFAKAFDYQTGGYGNAVLSKFPIEESTALLLPGITPPSGTNPQEVRSLAMVTVKIDEFNKIAFAGTELDATTTDEKHRQQQIDEILLLTKNITYPVIFGGNFNFNSLTNGTVYKSIIEQFSFGCFGNGCPLNAPKAAPTGTFDYITYRSADNRMSVVNYTTFGKSTSNFLPIVAELKLILLEE